VLAVGTLAIEQVLATREKLTELIGTVRRATYHGVETDVVALPHPSGASPWHKMEPGKTLLRRALARIAAHDEVRATFGARR
jgi:uracil-DNA glycosylase